MVGLAVVAVDGGSGSDGFSGSGSGSGSGSDCGSGDSENGKVAGFFPPCLRAILARVFFI